MNLPKEEQLKSDIWTSLSVIRFIAHEKRLSLGKNNARLIDENVVKILKYVNQLCDGYKGADE